MTTAAQDRFLIIQIRRGRFATLMHLRNDLVNASGVNVCTQTVRRRLYEGYLRSRRPCIRIPLTRRHRQARLEWARENFRWTR